MTYFNLVIEDRLSEAVLMTMLGQVKKKFAVNVSFPNLARDHASPGSGYIKKQLKGFNNAAQAIPFFVLTDLDFGECAPTLVKEWLTFKKHSNLIFRVAVREVEAWVLADRKAFASFIGIESSCIPQDVEEIKDPKKFLVDLARQSRKKEIKLDIVPRKGSTALVGPGYNVALRKFVMKDWRLEEAIKHSDSLRRAVVALENFQEQ